MSELKTTERTRVKRLPDRGRHDRETVNAILDQALIAHVAYEKDGEPAVLPTAHWRTGETLYIHGHSKNAMLHAARGTTYVEALAGRDRTQVSILNAQIERAAAELAVERAVEDWIAERRASAEAA